MLKMEDILESAGLSKNESKVYLTLLRLGSSPAGIIAEKSRVYRTNTYEALNRLIEKGLVSYIYKGHQKLFNAEDPGKILDFLKEKEESFKKALPELKLNHNLAKNKDKVSIYEGENGIKAIMDDILKQKVETNSFSEVLTFGVPKDMVLRVKPFIKQYHKKRIELKLHQKHLYDENAQRRLAYLNKLPYTEAAYLPNTINSPATTVIYGERVGFFIWSNPILCILIESKRMAEMYKKYFDILYSLSVKEESKKIFDNNHVENIEKKMDKNI